MDVQVSAAPAPRGTAGADLPASSLLRRPTAAAESERACAIAEAVVATVFDGPGARPRPRAAAFARQVAMYLAHVGFGISMAEVGKAFGRDRTTVVHACHVTEDRRDDPRFDVLLDHLEQAARALSAGERINRKA